MKLTQSEFDQKRAEKTLRFCFIGMSNIGKSHISQLLKNDFNFDIYEVDEQIQARMNLSDIGSSANWMGYPYDERYSANVATYLKLESEKTKAALISTTQNLVLDTTGSVIYLPDEIHKWLKENFLVINLDCADHMLAEMAHHYFKHPKPVVWGDSFKPQQAEDGLAALKRCYPQLLADRTKCYRTLADITLSGEVSRSQGISAQRILELIRLSLPR